MPGFAGIFSSSSLAEAGQARLLPALSGRPRASLSGVLPAVLPGVAASWCALAGTHLDSRPCWGLGRDVVVLACGELFALPAAPTLPDRDATDASLTGRQILAAYEEDPDSFLESLNGSFCGLLIDTRRKRALLFNDRFGAGRIYLHEAPDALYFATDAKALLALLPSARTLDPVAVAETLSMGCVLQDRTLFRGLTLLPAGACWTAAPGSAVEKLRYFDRREWTEQTALPDADFCDALQATFAELLPDYLRSTQGTAEPGIGMSLTGGLDGRMIMAWARRSPGSLPCYSFGSLYRDNHDVQLARRIAAACGQPHSTLIVGAEFLREFPDLAAECVEVSGGAMDVSGAVELFANRFARQVAPIRLTGNYGSEIVRGNVAFRPRPGRPGVHPPEIERLIEHAALTYHAERNVPDLDFVAFKQVPWHHHARLSVEQSVLTMRSPFLDNRLVKLMFRASPTMRASREPSMRLIRNGHPALARIPTDRGLVDGPAGPADRLRHFLREFSVRAEYAYDYGMPTWLVKLDGMVPFLRPERLFLGRHKFYHFRIWYRGPLAEYVRETLLSPNASVRQWYRPGVLESLVEAHLNGTENRTLDIHRALTLELTASRLLSTPPASALATPWGAAAR